MTIHSTEQAQNKTISPITTHDMDVSELVDEIKREADGICFYKNTRAKIIELADMIHQRMENRHERT